MKKLLIILPILVASCMSQARKDSMYDYLLMKWVKENPNAQYTDAVKAGLKAKSEKLSEEEVENEREEAKEAANKIAQEAARGNLVGAGAALVLLLGIGLGSYKKYRGNR